MHYLSKSMWNNKSKRVIDGKTWYCLQCKKKFSIRTNSFFARSYLSMYQIILIMYGFAVDFTQKDIAREPEINLKHTIVLTFIENFVNSGSRKIHVK